MPRVSIRKKNGFYFCKLWTPRIYVKYRFRSWKLVKEFANTVCAILDIYKDVDADLRIRLMQEYSWLYSIDRCLYDGCYGLMGGAQ